MGVAASTAGAGAGQQQPQQQSSSGSSSLEEDQLYPPAQPARRESLGERDRDSSQHTHATMRSSGEWLVSQDGAAPVVAASAAGGGSHASLARGWNRHSSGAHAGAAGERGSVDGGATSLHVKIMPLVQGKGEVKTFKLSAAGGVLQGGMAPEVRDIAREYEKVTGAALPRYQVEDRRAQQLLVTYVGEDYYVVPAPELFSRHTGTCRILGDKHQRAADHALQVGDFLRIGSVGLVVSEMHTGAEGGGGAVSITERDLYYLREDAGEIRDDLFALEEAATAAEEREGGGAPGGSPGKSPRLAQCYMCFDDEDSNENPLVAPCLCKGGTRYVHLGCLQKWQASAGDERDVVVSSAETKNACKVCKSKYKTHVRTSDGRLLPLMVHQLPPPFICFLVVTKHETAEELFNTQFQLSFSENKQIVIGRSRNCNMVLDYRTVSTQHATVTFRKGGFYFRDLSSSNGSMLNLRRPLKLPYNQWVRLRHGRSIVAFKAKRSWMRRKLSSMSMGAAAASLASAAVATSGGGTGTGTGTGANPRMSASRQLQLELDQLPNQRRREQHPSSSENASSASDATSVASATGGGGGLSPREMTGTLRDQVELLESLCRIDATPRLRAALSGSGGLLTPGGGRFYQSIAGESMSPSAISAALFQLHLQAASSRRGLGAAADPSRASGAFDPVLLPGAAGFDSFADAAEAEGGEGGAAAAAAAAVTVVAGSGAPEGEQQPPQAQQRAGGTGGRVSTKPPQEDVVGQGLRDAFPGVRFVHPAESPVAGSQASQLST